MLKPTSLRNALLAAVPALRQNPQALQLTPARGQIVSTLAASLSFECRYTLNVMISGYAGELDDILPPLLAWLRDNQPDIMTSDEGRENGVTWSVTPGENGQEIALGLLLSERAMVENQSVTWLGEPPLPQDVTRPMELWMKDELVSRWEE